MESINETSAIKYWQNFENVLGKKKENTTKECGIEETCFSWKQQLEGIYSVDTS